nr:MAG TPA: hypothetical protein [Caudoviricetes sp.]
MPYPFPLLFLKLSSARAVVVFATPPFWQVIVITFAISVPPSFSKIISYASLNINVFIKLYNYITM